MNQDATITVIDDGEGMDQEGLKQHWIIGKSNKRELPALPRGRQQIGKFGIGKLATYVLAERLTHISKSGKKYYSTSMDYRAIEQRVDQGFAPKTPIKIALHELTEPEAKRAVESWTLACASAATRSATALISAIVGPSSTKRISSARPPWPPRSVWPTQLSTTPLALNQLALNQSAGDTLISLSRRSSSVA